MSRDITALHPEVQEIIPKFLQSCEKQGLKVKITDTVRTKEEQNKLYAQGRTTPGKIVTWVKYPYSNHNWGMAFDICRNDGKGAYNDSDGWFKKVALIAKSYGLTWGGDWKDSPDKPHFELVKYGTTTTLSRKYGTPENFKKTWKTLNKEKYMHIKSNYEYNGKLCTLDVINEDGNNYIKVKDIAQLINKDIAYNSNTKTTTFTDKFNTLPLLFNNKSFILESININGSNFIKLRDICHILNVEVLFNEITKKIQLSTQNKPFSIFKK